ncbi:MAG: metallopeptidase family protein [Alphaproteobacteria bacterium]|nr:metallopeptidase family protein [Alphaproteobacteria bacterium]
MAREQRHTTPPTLADIDAIARSVLLILPEVLRRRVTGVVLRVEEVCDVETETEMDLESPFDLLGLYRGTSLPRRSVLDPGGAPPDMIFLFRRPILDYWCESGEDLTRLIRHVMIHEIGHHFGFSDEDMERIEGMV